MDCGWHPAVHTATVPRLLAAVQKSGALRTHTLHADIVVNHSGSKHISAALNTFGINAGTTRVLAARVNASDSDVQQICALVQGQQVPVPEQLIGNEAKLRKAFKVSPQELSIGNLEEAAICKGAMLDS